MHLGTHATDDGRVAQQRSTITAGQRAVPHTLDRPEPPRFFDVTAIQSS